MVELPELVTVRFPSKVSGLVDPKIKRPEPLLVIDVVDENVLPPEPVLSVAPPFTSVAVLANVEPLKYNCGNVKLTAPLNVVPDSR